MNLQTLVLGVFFIMSDENTKITANRQKKMDIVTKLNEKLANTKAIIFTNYQGLTHKQLEGLKKTIKPLKADYVVAKNSLVLRALEANKIKIEDKKQLDGPTGTLLIYDDISGPLKALAKLIKELGIPSVKFGIMDSQNLTGEQILKISTLPNRETLLAQVVGGLKSPIFGLHRVLNWNLQKFIMTLNAVAAVKPALAVATTPISVPAAAEPVETPVVESETSEPATSDNAATSETIEKVKTEETKEEVKIEGGEN